jgi:photoactive yellow protein
MTPSLDDDAFVSSLDQLSLDAIDALPFGVIRLDADGVVTLLSATEARQSGVGARPVLGLRFFADLAPCMWTEAFQARYDAAAAAGTLDVTFDQIGDFDDRTRHLHVRARSASGGGVWLLLDRRV